jgi:hypothetical protein
MFPGRDLNPRPPEYEDKSVNHLSKTLGNRLHGVGETLRDMNLSKSTADMMQYCRWISGFYKNVGLVLSQTVIVLTLSSVSNTTSRTHDAADTPNG